MAKNKVAESAEHNGPNEKGLMLCRRYENAKNKRLHFDDMWRDLHKHVMPEESMVDRMAMGAHIAEPGAVNRSDYDSLFDTTAARANWIAANGQFSNITHPGAPWSAFEPPRNQRNNDRVVKFWKERTEIAFEMLAASQFYAQIYRVFLQRGGYGTALTYCEPGRTRKLHVKSFPVGTYALEENEEGDPVITYREFLLTARVALELFGEDELSGTVLKAAKSEQPEERERKFPFMHIVEPRRKFDPKKQDPLNMPWASFYVDVEGKRLIREGGYWSNPYSVSRYHETHLSPYGWCPGFLALPDARQLNHLERILDTAAEKRVDPPMLVPANMAGDHIDVSAGGVTFFNPWLPQQGQPREWALSNDINTGFERAEMKRRQIEQAFHVDLFQMFANLEGTVERTALEISERANEKLTQFYPTFALFTAGYLDQFMRRILQISFEIEPPGPDTPEEVFIGQEGGSLLLPDPQITYSSPLALALKRVHNTSFLSTLSGLGELMMQFPQLADHFNMDAIVREYGRNEGMPEQWIADMDQVEAVRQQRAQAEAQQQRMAEQMAQAEALGKTKGMPTEEINEKITEFTG